MLSCIRELEAVVQVCVARKDGKDPKISHLLGLRSRSRFFISFFSVLIRGGWSCLPRSSAVVSFAEREVSVSRQLESSCFKQNDKSNSLDWTVCFIFWLRQKGGKWRHVASRVPVVVYLQSLLFFSYLFNRKLDRQWRWTPWWNVRQLWSDRRKFPKSSNTSKWHRVYKGSPVRPVRRGYWQQLYDTIRTWHWR